MSKNKQQKTNYSEYGKLPPNAVEFEEAIIGGILNYPDRAFIALRVLQPDFFYKTSHGHIFRAIKDIVAADMIPTSEMITNNLTKNGFIYDVGGSYYLYHLETKYTTTTNMEFQSLVVLDMYIKRKMIQLFSDKIQDLYNPRTDLYVVYEEILAELEGLFGTFETDVSKHIKDVIAETLEEINNISSGSKISFIKCGDRLFDEVIYTGPEQIISIAAPRAAGKTRYLIKIIRGFAMNNNPKDVAFLWYSMEDSDKKIVRAFASTKTGLSDAQMLSKGYTLKDSEKQAIAKEIESFSNYDIQIENSQDTINQIDKKFMKFIKKRKDKINFLIIDNVMLIKDLYESNDKNQTSIEDAVAAKISEIKNKTKKNGYKTVIIFLHHMTKEMEGRANFEEAYRPKLTHMKGSTRFADICTSSILINYIGSHKDLIKKNSQLPDILCKNSDGTTKYYKRELLMKNLLVIEVAKNRDGEMANDDISIIRYLVDFKTMKFTELQTFKNNTQNEKI